MFKNIELQIINKTNNTLDNKTEVKNKYISNNNNTNLEQTKDNVKEYKRINLINEYPSYTIGEDINL